MRIHKLRIILTVFCMLLFTTVSWGATITGTVANSSGKSGRIYLWVEWAGGGNTGAGVSLPAAGDFTIRGVQPNGTYYVRAFMDTQGTNVQHANDPQGSSVEVTVGADSGSAGTITLNNPTPVAPQAPGLMVTRSTSGNLLMWNGPESDDLPIADKYLVSWSANGFSTVLGTTEVASGLHDFYIHKDAPSNYAYKVTAVVNGMTPAESNVALAPLPTGTGSVTGTVTFSGTPTGPLYVLLVDESSDPPNFNATAVSAPVSGGTYTISNVLAANYFVVAFLDMNNNGAYDLGDVGWLDNDDFLPNVTVTAGELTSAADIQLNNVNYSASLYTQHSSNQWGESYNIAITVQSMKKRVVNVELTSGPQLVAPVDVSFDGDQEFNGRANVPGRPTAGDTYQVKVTYLDGTTETAETVARSVTAVIDGLPDPVAPVGYVAYEATPTFSWSAPSPAPATDYTYGLWMNATNGSGWWDVWAIPSTTTSLEYASQGEYDPDTLTDGTTYRWSIEAKDSDGNTAQTEVEFTPTSLPAVNSFSPVGGLPGTTVVINGVNLSPAPVVRFNGVTASVTDATSTSLTLTVPPGATTGKIQVGTFVTSRDFIVAEPITITGKVLSSLTQLPIPNARVEKQDDSAIYATTAADGSYSLDLFPVEAFHLKITHDGYIPTYTTPFFWLSEDLDMSAYPSHLYTSGQLTAWGVTAGKGVVIGRVLNTGTTPYTAVNGAAVTAQSTQNFPDYYPPTYFDGTSFGGTSTYGNGIFFIRNVNAYDWVNVQASKPIWSFQQTGFNTYAGSVTEGGVFGQINQPQVYYFDPSTGTAGTTVTIVGNNFSPVPAENTVIFEGAVGTEDDVTAEVKNAESGSLTITVPAGAVSGNISVTTAGGYSSQGYFMVKNTLAVEVNGTGSGTVTSSYSDSTISCQSGLSAGCTADYTQGSWVELTATVSDGSLFSGWAGCDSVYGDNNVNCTLTLNTDRAVTATFSQEAVQGVMVEGGNYYATILEAYTAALDAGIIRTKIGSFTGPHDLNRAISVTIKGGYDDVTSGSQTGYTALGAPLTVTSGSVTLDRIEVE